MFFLTDSVSKMKTNRLWIKSCQKDHCVPLVPITLIDWVFPSGHFYFDELTVSEKKIIVGAAVWLPTLAKTYCLMSTLTIHMDCYILNKNVLLNCKQFKYISFFTKFFQVFQSWETEYLSMFSILLMDFRYAGKYVCYDRIYLAHHICSKQFGHVLNFLDIISWL